VGHRALRYKIRTPNQERLGSGWEALGTYSPRRWMAHQTTARTRANAQLMGIAKTLAGHKSSMTGMRLSALN